MNQHERIEELIAARSLDGLDDSEVRDLDRLMAEHGDRCAECRRLARDYGEVAGRLAFAAAPEEIPAGFEERVVSLAVRPGRARPGWRGVAAAVAAAILLAAGGLGGYLVRGGSEAPRAVTLTSATGGAGTATLVYQPHRGSAILVGSGLETLSSDRVYEMWVINGDTPEPAGTFHSSGAQVVVPVRADVSAADLFAITVERAPGAKRPTTKPIFSAPIRSS